MQHTATRAILRQGLTRAELARVVSYDAAAAAAVVTARPSFTAAAVARAQCLHPDIISAPRLPGSYPRRAAVALFHTTAPAYKRKARESEPEENDKGRGKGKGQKAQQGNGAAVAAADQDGDPNGPKHPPANPDEPLDFADVQSRLGSHDAHFRDAMKKLRTGGRFNPDAIGSLRVAPDRKKPGITYPLHELAQVVPHAGGRTISILAYEEESVKPIMSAVQASPDFNQQPQRDADNELELVLKIEPESRDDVLKRVKATCHDWREKLRAVRQRRDKIHVAWRKEGLLGPDLKRTVDKQLDKLIKTKMTEIDDLEKETMKATESK